MIQQAIAKVVNGTDLTESEMTQAMEAVTDGNATPAQIAAFLIGLRTKGETVDEIAAAAEVIRKKITTLPIGSSDVCLDRDEINVDLETVASTREAEGEKTTTFNVSTTTAFVTAGAGLRVAKHGHLSASSRFGSADVLQALDIPLNLTPRQVGDCVDKVGIGFLYAPQLHGFMSHVVGPRQEIGLRTIFNLLGPLANPGGATAQVLGVYSEEITEPLAQVLTRLGCRNGFVVYGGGVHDEVSITGPSKLTRIVDGQISTSSFVPEDVGLERAQPEEITGGNARENAAITKEVLRGERGARRNMVLLNSAAALVAAGKAESLKDGVALAEEAIDSGRAMEKLEQLVALSNDMALPSETPSGWGWSS